MTMNKLVFSNVPVASSGGMEIRIISASPNSRPALARMNSRFARPVGAHVRRATFGSRQLLDIVFNLQQDSFVQSPYTTAQTGDTIAYTGTTTASTGPTSSVTNSPGGVSINIGVPGVGFSGQLNASSHTTNGPVRTVTVAQPTRTVAAPTRTVQTP